MLAGPNADASAAVPSLTSTPVGAAFPAMMVLVITPPVLI
jgi:hypothetical protein